MALGSTREIAGFDCSLIERMLRNDFKYKGKIDDLEREDDEIVVRLYDNKGLDIRIVRKEYFKLKSIVVQNYIRQRDGPVTEITDRGRQLCMIGYKVENENDAQ